MLIECLVRRVGVTIVDLPPGARYIFQPNRFAKQGQVSTSVCEVGKSEHLAWMRRFPNTYREYDDERTREEVEIERQKKTGQPGYSIQKYGDVGYLIQDLRDRNKPLFAGSAAVWKDKAIDALPPWKTEFEAYEWVKGEMEFEATEETSPSENPDPEEKAEESTIEERAKELVGMTPPKVTKKGRDTTAKILSEEGQK